MGASSPKIGRIISKVRVSLIEAEELAFVRSLGTKQRRRAASDVGIKKCETSIPEMKEVCVVSQSSSVRSLRAGNSSFDSIPLEAPGDQRSRPITSNIV